MTKYKIITGVILSLAVASMALGGPGGDRDQGRRGSGGHDRQGVPGRMLTSPEMAEKLALSESQIEAVKEADYEAQKQQINLRAEADQARLDLRRLLESDDPSESQVMAAIERAGEARIEMQKAKVGAMLKVRATLGAETWNKAKSLLRENRERRGRRGSEAMRHRGEGRRGGGEGRRGRGGPNSRPGPRGEGPGPSDFSPPAMEDNAKLSLDADDAF